MNYTIHSAQDFDITDLVAVLNTCYENYPVPIHFSPSQLEFFIRAQDIDLSLSVVTTSKTELVGLAQLARRGERGWVAGLGVCPGYRRSGLARNMMQQLTENATVAGIRHLQLEVLQQNTAAISLYQDLGWRTRRELLIWNRQVESTPGLRPAILLLDMNPAEILSDCYQWHVLPPCWQREKQTLQSYLDVGLKGWAIIQRGEVIAYLLGFPPRQGVQHLMDAAIKPATDQLQTGSMLFRASHWQYPDVEIMLANDPPKSAISRTLTSMAYRVSHRQHEMFLEI